MANSICIDLSASHFASQPFAHFYSTSVLQSNIESQLFDWFEQTKVWSLTQTDFYEQYEFNFLNVKVPSNLQCLIDAQNVNIISNKIKKEFNVKTLDLVGVAAHKLVDGHRIGLHNDFINGEETHRLVIHINPSWNEINGGLLILFNSPQAKDISKIINPINNSAFAFEISSESYHAVSKIYNFCRYTLIYTFKQNMNEFD